MESVESEVVSDVYYDDSYVKITDMYRLDKSFIAKMALDPFEFEDRQQDIRIRIGNGVLKLSIFPDPEIEETRICQTIEWNRNANEIL